MGGMKFIVDGKEHDFDEASLTNTEVMAIEAACGCTYGEWSDLLRRNSMQATTALVWVGLRRENPGLAFKDCKFVVRDLIPTPEETPETAADPTTPAPKSSGASPSKAKTANS